MKRWLRALGMTALLLSLAATAAAQNEQHGAEVSKVVRLNRAPVNKQVLKVKLPRPQVTKLPNGLTVIVLERHKLPTINFALWIKTGALADPGSLPGLASFTASMLREGTETRSSAQLATAVDNVGGSVSANADFGSNLTEISASGLVDNMDTLLDVMSDETLRPTFPNSELDKFRQRQLANLQFERSNPSFLGNEKLHQLVYQNFPAAVVAPTAESVQKVTSADLKKFHDEYFLPNNAILGVVGDTTPAQVMPMIQKYFGSWASHPVHEPPLAALPLPAPSKITLIDRPGSVQTNILAGDYAVRRDDPDYIPLFVMNRILGGGPSARLFIDLREEKGYTYGAYSNFNANIFPGLWSARTEVRNAVTDGSMQALIAEFKKIREEKVPVPELDEAKRAIVAGFALSLESPETLLGAWMNVNYYKLPEDYWDNYTIQISKVTQDQVQSMARRFVDLDHIQYVCVGDGKQIKDVLKKYGQVQVFDTNGKAEN
jgi:zinc protease